MTIGENSKPDYGVDAPYVIRNLFLGGIACLLLGFFLPRHIHLGQVDFLPRPMLLVGAWFLLTGLACIGLGDTRSLAPFTMSGAYAVGMALVAAIHYLSARKASIDENEEF